MIDEAAVSEAFRTATIRERTAALGWLREHHFPLTPENVANALERTKEVQK